MAETIANPPAASQQNLVNPITGFLSKAADTALEIALVREGAKAESKRAIGSIAPSGQLDPARMESNKQTANEPETKAEQKATVNGNLPIIIGISAATVVVIGVLYMASKKRGK